MKQRETSKIKIGDKSIEFRFSVRSIMNYNELSGKSAFEITSYNDTILYYYCAYEAANEFNNEENGLKYKEFITLLDLYPEALDAITEAFTTINQAKKK